ncbi:MAG TPA: type II secretion system F family protein [Bryobacteraceae bacterium]|jgi:tight adherence protein B|nr:type II secretion system F family protein [Bryobacteraceae bacterium]
MLILSILAFFAAIFLLAAITVAVAWMGFVKQTGEAEEAAQEHAAVDAADGDPALFRSDLLRSDLFRDDRLSSFSFWDNLLARFDFIEILKVRMAQAQLEWSVGRVIAFMLFSGTVAGLLLMRILPPWAAFAGALAIAFLPYGYVLRAREKRFRAFREAFPDVLDSMARALRAGYPLPAAVDMVASDSPEPIATELKKASAEANLGMGWARALENLARRIPILEVNVFISAVVLHARTGGKLGEVLGGVAENMREAISLQGEVRALAAHGKLTGAILTVLPLAIAAMMTIFSPSYMLTLYNHPMGKTLIAGAIGCLILAQVVIRKIVDIKL